MAKDGTMRGGARMGAGHKSKPLPDKEGSSVTRQNGEIEWTGIKRTSDGRYQAVADEDENGFTAAMGETFLDTVYEPTFADSTSTT